MDNENENNGSVEEAVPADGATPTDMTGFVVALSDDGNISVNPLPGTKLTEAPVILSMALKAAKERFGME